MGTTLRVTNGTGLSSVGLYLTLGSPPGNAVIQDFPCFTSIGGSYLAGYMTLGPYESYTLAPTSYMNGNLCFGCQPQCPGSAISQFPYGTSIFEFTLNTPKPRGGGVATESFDISCVNGVNSFISVNVSGPDSGGGTWIVNGQAAPLPIANGGAAYKANYGLYGVYPAGCTVCTAVSNPPCPNVPNQKPQAKKICQLARPASEAGGTVYVTFNGYYPASASG